MCLESRPFINLTPNSAITKMLYTNAGIILRGQIDDLAVILQHNGIFLDKAETRDSQALTENGEMPVIGIGATVSTLVIDCVDRKTAGHYT